MKTVTVLVADGDDHDDLTNARFIRQTFSRAFNFMPEYDGSILGPIVSPGQFITPANLERAINAASFAIVEIQERKGRGVMPEDEREGLSDDLAACRTGLKRWKDALEFANKRSEKI